jgi:hypothetical protein
MSDEKTTTDLEAQATASSTTLPTTNTHHDVEKVDSASIISSSDADSNHEDIEEMDAGRQTDLAIDKVRLLSLPNPNTLY